MATSWSSAESLNTINTFLQDVSAHEKSAETANTEPTTVGGVTEHPSKNVDDSTEDAAEGSRAEENEKDIKEDYGGAAVDDSKSAEGVINPGGTAAADDAQIGTKKAPTGDDPANETASVKAKKDDPAGSGGPTGNSTHPARTDNDELDGQKYAEMSLEELTKVASALGADLLTELAVGAAPTATDKVASADAAGQAGWELAELLSGGDVDKQAADAVVQSTLEEIIKQAAMDADNVAIYLAQQKEAMHGGEELAADPAAMQGGETIPPEALEEGGMPPEGSADGGGNEAELAQLLQVIEQLGISPEELAQIMSEGEGAGGDPGMGGEAAAMPPAEAPAPEESAAAAPGMEVEAAVKQAVAATIKELADAKKAEEAKTSAANTARDYIQEILARS